MFRLTLLLSGAIFLAMMIGGQDRGQLRFGLMQPAETARPAPVRAAPPAPEVEPVAFVPTAPVVVKPAAPAPPPAALPEAAEVAAAATILYVDATRVNVREGPGRGHAVIGRLSRGEAVEVVAGDVDGWSLIRIEGDGLQGYVASQLLVP